jgi:formate hydrogenlyase subunit 3/multisubunit Na+/H+ antiporter MnhD subunit
MLLPNIIKDKYLRIVGALSLLLLFITAIIFYLTAGAESKSLIVHFEPSLGIDVRGGRGNIFSVLFSALVIILINLFLANFLYTRKRFLSYIFSFAGLWLAILILAAVGVIISVN